MKTISKNKAMIKYFKKIAEELASLSYQMHGSEFMFILCVALRKKIQLFSITVNCLFIARTMKNQRYLFSF